LYGISIIPYNCRGFGLVDKGASPDAWHRGIPWHLTKEIFDRKGLAYIESILSDKERYAGGGMAFRW